MKNLDYVIAVPGPKKETITNKESSSSYGTSFQLEEALEIEAEREGISVRDLTTKAQLYYLKAKKIEREGGRICAIGKVTIGFGTDSIGIK